MIYQVNLCPLKDSVGSIFILPEHHEYDWKFNRRMVSFMWISPTSGYHMGSLSIENYRSMPRGQLTRAPVVVTQPTTSSPYCYQVGQEFDPDLQSELQDWIYSTTPERQYAIEYLSGIKKWEDRLESAKTLILSAPPPFLLNKSVHENTHTPIVGSATKPLPVEYNPKGVQWQFTPDGARQISEHAYRQISAPWPRATGGCIVVLSNSWHSHNLWFNTNDQYSVFKESCARIPKDTEFKLERPIQLTRTGKIKKAGVPQPILI